MTAQTQSKELKGFHVLLWLGAFFGLMFAVNGVFLYQAIVSFPGEDTPKSYVRGLDYNSVLEQRARQAELGWTAQMGVLGEDLVLRLSDRNESPVSHRTVTGALGRLATTANDGALPFVASAPGEYRADISHLQSGQWNVEVGVLDLDGETIAFTAAKEITLP